MKKKKIIVLWSGGLDSTYLVWKSLCDGHDVTTYYMNITNNCTKSEREQNAISKIRKEFDKYSFSFKGNIDVSIPGGSNNFMLPQSVCWPLVLPACRTVDEFHIGYVMNDDAISFIPELQEMYTGYKNMVGNLPELKFPLIKLPKQTIWESLPQNIRKHVTWCENRKKKDNCGECSPCKRHKFSVTDKLNKNNV